MELQGLIYEAALTLTLCELIILLHILILIKKANLAHLKYY